MRPPKHRGSRAHNPRQTPNQQEQASANSGQPSPHPQGEGASIDAHNTYLQAKEEERYTQKRRFWQRQIRVAKWLNWITMGAAVIALGGLVFLYRSIVGADDATMRANRAWIAPRGVSLDMEHSSQKAVVLVLEYENIGKEPAVDVVISKHINDFEGPAVINADHPDLPIEKNGLLAVSSGQ